MAREIIDISVALQSGIGSDPPFMLPKITYLDHRDTLPSLLAFFPGLAAADLPDGEAWAIEQVAFTTHNGTHLDAPWHYASTMNRASTDRASTDRGERAATIDEVPLEWCFQPGVKLDFRDFDDGYVVTPADLEAELARIGHELRPLDIVLMNTAAGACYGADDYINRGCGCGRAGTLWLLERGVRVTGTDGWSWDAPFSKTAEAYARTRDAGLIWEGHKAGREIRYCHLEKLANLDRLPPSGFEVCCFPVKIKAASAGWTRAVAIVDR